MNREAVKARIVELKATLEKTLNDANALAGAIQDCEYWLQQIELVDSKPALGEDTAAASK